MVSPRASQVGVGSQQAGAISSPSSEAYFTARSRSVSADSSGSTARRLVALAPLSGDGRPIGVSRSLKRKFKDRRIYVNHRTGLPVRPPTSFGLFKHALRRNMSDNRVSFFDFNKRTTEQWAQMRAQDKEPYVQRARELAGQYKKVEVHFLRKKVRQMMSQRKGARRAQEGAASASSAAAASTSSRRRRA